jgi:hypothetical protein
VRDAIAFARRGIPSVALVAEPFWEQGDAVANGAGMSGVPRLMLPYPVAGLPDEELKRLACASALPVLGLLRGDG